MRKGVFANLRTRSWLGALLFVMLSSSAFSQKITTFPYTEDFESESNCGTSCATTCTLSGDFENETGDDADWLVDSNGTTSTNTGPSADNTLGTSAGKYIYTEASSCSNNISHLRSPEFDFTNVDDPALEFYYHMYGADMGTMEVSISTDNGSTWSSPVWSLSGEQQTDNDDPFEKAIISLCTYGGNNSVRFRLTGTRGSSFDSDMAVDDIQVFDSAFCALPSTTGATNIAATTATISWSDVCALSYDYEVVPAGNSQGNGVIASGNVASTSSNVTGLTANTDYDYFVRAICSASPGDTTAWVASTTFTTVCTPEIAPYQQSFDQTTLPGCWSEYAESGGPWTFDGAGFGWNTTGCSATPSDHTGNGGNYAAMDHSTTDDSVVLEMPEVDVTSLTTPWLSFYHFMCAEGYSPVNMTIVEAWDGTNWALIDTIQEGDAAWREYGYDLTNFTYGSNLLRVRFRAESGGSSSDFYGDIAIDDISIDEKPACPNPSDLTASNLTTTSADIDWVEKGSSTNWVIEYGTTGFLLGSGTKVATGAKPYTITALTENTRYDAYVRAACSVQDSSDWIGPLTFETECDSKSGSYAHAFDTSDELDGCWSIINNTPGWVLVEPAPLGTSPFNGLNSIEFYNSSTTSDPRNLMLVSPQFTDLDNTKRIRLHIYDYSNSSDIIIGTMSNPTDTSTFTAYDTLFEADLADDVWEEHIINFSNYTGTDEYIAIAHGMNTTFDYFHIDNFFYEDIPTCFRPENFAVTNIGIDSAILNWDDTNTPPATQWNIEYGQTGFTPGTGTIVTTSSNIDYELLGLMGNTVYDVYVRADCGGGDESFNAGPITFATECDVQSSFPYFQDFDAITPNNGSVNCGTTDELGDCFSNEAITDDGDWIPRSIGTASSNTGPSADHTGNGGNYVFIETSGCAGDVKDMYSTEFDFTSIGTPRLSFWYHMFGGDMGDLEISSSTDGGQTWSDPFVTISGDQGDQWLNQVVTLPLLANESSVIFRFRGISGPDFESDLAIDDIRVDEAPANEVGITNIIANGCSDAETITIEVSNFGGAAQSNIPVAYTTSNGNSVMEIIPDNLPVGGSISYTFQATSDFSAVGTYSIEAYTSLAGDADLSNDTAVIQVTTTPTYATNYATDFEAGLPADWATDGIVGTGHGSPSSVLYQNLWSVVPDFTVISSKVGPISTGDELKLMYRYVDFGGSNPATTLGVGDTMGVFISTDCGASFTLIDAIHAGNHTATTEMTPLIYDLSAYDGQEIVVAIYAVWGTGDYFLDLDNFYIGGEFALSATVDADVACADGSEGQATATISNGVSPYTIDWGSNSGNQSTLVATNLDSGTYIVTVTDDLGYELEESVTIDVLDATAPTAIAQNITAYLDATGSVTVSAADVDNNSTDNCTISTRELDITDFDCDDIGMNSVILTITDNNGLSSTANAQINVLDTISPVVLTQDITVQLDASGAATITPSDIDNNSTDNCTIDSYALDITTFDCDDLGDNTVTLTVTDNGGNSSTGTATVTVEDVALPTVVTQDITIQLNADGQATIMASSIDNGSTDNCSIDSYSLDITTFDCNSLGDNTVTLTVTDNSGNSNTGTATVTVEDVTNPTAIAQNIVIKLDELGQASITTDDIDNGSSDNCSISSLSLDKTDFDCSNLGTNAVILTVRDESGNTATDELTVTVEDDIDPEIVCPADIEVINDAGQTSAVVNYTAPVGTDNCSNPTTSLVSGLASGSSFPLGVSKVSYEVVDGSGNNSFCTFVVNVLYRNEQPDFTASNPADVNEDAGEVVVSNWASFRPTVESDINAEEASQQVLRYVVSNVSNPSLFARLPEINVNGDLIYTPAENTSGSSSFEVAVQDNGGIANGGVDQSAFQTFTITITDVNDAPTIDQVANFEMEATADVSVSLTGISSGSPLEDQALTVTATSSNPSIISLDANAISYNSADATGTLAFTSQPNATGNVTITVTVQDDGGTANGGVNETTMSFDVTVKTSRELFIPELFTPNGDGMNDNLTVMGHGIETISFKIYDREGNVVYETTNVIEATTIGWDGKSDGTDQPTGIYSWDVSGTMVDQSSFRIRSSVSNSGQVILSR